MGSQAKVGGFFHINLIPIIYDEVFGKIEKWTKTWRNKSNLLLKLRSVFYQGIIDKFINDKNILRNLIYDLEAM